MLSFFGTIRLLALLLDGPPSLLLVCVFSII